MADDGVMRAYRSNVEDRRFAAEPYVDSLYARRLLRDRASGATANDWRDRAITRAEDIGGIQGAIAGQGQQGPIMSMPDPQLQLAFQQAIAPRNPEIAALLFDPVLGPGDLPRRR